MNPIVLIPARMDSSRLPGKPLADIGGLAMVVRVHKRAEASGVGPVVVAAAQREIAEEVEAAGGRAVLTDPSLPSGSDRILAALKDLDPDRSFDCVVDLQGDMPFIQPEVIAACVGVLAQVSECAIATMVAPESSEADRDDPAVVKAILAVEGEGRCARALWFTRSRLYGEGPVWRHLGLYAFRREALEAFAAAPPSPLEIREGLEQLRALEMGLPIWAGMSKSAPISVDTPADLAAARRQAQEGRS